MEDIKNYKCPCCGAPLFFSEAEGNLKCDSCGNHFSPETMEQLSDAEHGSGSESRYSWDSFEPREFDEAETENLASYTCPSCGADITGDSTMGSTVCPYCGNATIVKGKFEGSLRPDFIIPFKIDKKRAVEIFEADALKRPFLPKEFKDRKKITEMTGIYVPFWAFGCCCDASITYNAALVSAWADSEYNYEKTDFFRLYRSGSVTFNHIPVDGSRKADDSYMDALEPFDYSEAVNFNTAYLSGFLSDKYDVSAEESVERANLRVKKSTEDVFARTATGYMGVTPLSSSVSFSDGKIRYALLPVWMLNIKYKDTVYKYAVNGQTGKVVGEYPTDRGKKNRYFVLSSLISGAAAAVAAALIAGLIMI